MLIQVKSIKRQVGKMYDERWCFILPEEKLVITESYPPDNLFPRNFISNAIDEDMDRTVEFIGRNNCEKYLCPYVFVMENTNLRGIL